MCPSSIVSLGESALGLLPAALTVTAYCPVAMLVVGGNSCCHGDTAQLLCFLPIVSLGESALGLLPAALIVTACCPVAMLVVGETPVVMVTVAGVGVPDTDSSLLTVCNMAPLCTVMV